MGKLGGFAEGAQITGDTFGVGDHGEELHSATAVVTREDVIAEASFQELCPWPIRFTQSGSFVVRAGLPRHNV